MIVFRNTRSQDRTALMRKFPLQLILFFLLLSNVCSAANHYILPSPGGSWVRVARIVNACSGFSGNCSPGSMVRGDTYYVGGGSYPGRYNFNVAASGATYITILGATLGNSGSVPGWSSSYDVSTHQAVFGSGIEFDTSYWVFRRNCWTEV